MKALHNICDQICNDQPYCHNKLKSILLLNVVATLNHYPDTAKIVIDGWVCLYRWLLDPVKPPGFTTEPVGPLRWINRTEWGYWVTHPLIHDTRNISELYKKVPQNPALLTS